MDWSHHWTQFKQEVRQTLRAEEYDGWLEHIELVEISLERVVIAGIPHPIFRDDIRKNYDPLFRQILSEIFPEFAPFKRKKVLYTLGKAPVSKKPPEQTEFPFQKPTQKSAAPETMARESVTPEAFKNVAVSSKSAIESQPVVESKPVKSTKVASATKTPKKEVSDNVLPFPSLFQNKYALDNFVCGPSNELAYEASLKVIEQPGAVYSPLYLYGDIGLGKTHLLESIGHEMQAQDPEKKIVYCTAESFLNEFIQHLQKRQMAEFREKYRSADVLLLDDLQVLAGASSCQEELLHTLQSIRQKHGQVVVTSQKVPGKLERFNQALCSQLESGLLADLKTPGLEMRMAILERKAEADQIFLPPEVCCFIAHSIHSSIRKLEGALIRLGAHASLLRQSISLEFAKQALVDLLEAPEPDLQTLVPASVAHQDPVMGVLERVCQVHRLKLEDLQSNRRDAVIVQGRQLAIYLLKELTTLSLNEIGSYLGNRSHSAIHYSLNQATKRFHAEPELLQQAERLQHELQEQLFPQTMQRLKRLQG